MALLKKSHAAGKFSMHCLHFVFVLNEDLSHHQWGKSAVCRSIPVNYENGPFKFYCAGSFKSFFTEGCCLEFSR